MEKGPLVDNSSAHASMQIITNNTNTKYTNNSHNCKNKMVGRVACNYYDIMPCTCATCSGALFCFVFMIIT